MTIVDPGSQSETRKPGVAVQGSKPGGTGGARSREGGVRSGEGLWGWLMVSPALLMLALFLLAPIVLAVWVSLLKWNGQVSPFAGSVPFVGLDNYKQLFTQPGLQQTLFMTSLRNTFYYVLFVVPLQTALALGLAVLVNQRWLKGKGGLRTAFYFPSVTSSIAVSVIFLFLFQGSGAVNKLLAVFGIQGPNWFADPRGLIQLLLDKLHLVDINNPPAWLSQHDILGLSLWDWFAGPSVALTTIIILVTWTTAGTFMLMFLAALQDIPKEIEEASLLDGTSNWERFRYVTVPMLKPTLFLVLTLGLIGTWQVFDQVYVMSQGQPANTTLTPAYLSYREGFNDSRFGTGAAIAFILFLIIIVMTVIQRTALRDRDTVTVNGKRHPLRRLLPGSR